MALRRIIFIVIGIAAIAGLAIFNYGGNTGIPLAVNATTTTTDSIPTPEAQADSTNKKTKAAAKQAKAKQGKG